MTLLTIVTIVSITLLAVVTAILINERTQRKNLEDRNRKLRKNLRSSND